MTSQQQCQYLEPSGNRCKHKAVDEFVIFKDPEVRESNESWFIVKLCDVHKQDKDMTYKRICEDFNCS